MEFLWTTGSSGESGSAGGDWFTKNGWIISLIFSIILVIAFIVVLILFIKDSKKNKKEKNEETNVYLDCFGGKDNIISAEAKGSRLIVVLKDYSKLDENKLKEVGIESLIKATDKVTFIVGTKATEIASTLNK